MLSGNRRDLEPMLPGLIALAWLASLSVAGEAAPGGRTLAGPPGDAGALPFATGAPADCRPHLPPPFPLAGDTTSCGGTNVSFTTVDRRTKP
ncbi:hypothetical protein [Methylobacterium sp. Gmos1]